MTLAARRILDVGVVVFVVSAVTSVKELGKMI